MAETQGTPQRPGDPPVHAPILGAECRCDAAVRSAVGKHPSKHRRLTEAEREAAYRQRVERRQRLAHLASRHQRAAALRWTPLVETRLIPSGPSRRVSALWPNQREGAGRTSFRAGRLSSGPRRSSPTRWLRSRAVT
jgi:hypothetical protein